MKHSDYIAKARRLLYDHGIQNAKTLTELDKIFILVHNTDWSRDQCVKIVEELEGKRTYIKRGSKAFNLDTLFSDSVAEPSTVTDTNYFSKLMK